VEDMDMPEVKGMNMVEEQDHPMNHRLGEEGMNMVEVNGMNTMEGMNIVTPHVSKPHDYVNHMFMRL
jgi:hypothetical protein